MDTVRRSVLAEALAVFWLCVAIGIWSYLIDRGLNFWFTPFVMTCGMWVVAMLLPLLFDQRVPAFVGLHDWLVRFGFANAIVQGFWIGAIFTGSLGKTDNISVTCIGLFHLHHWLKSAVAGTFFILVPFKTDSFRYRFWIYGIPLIALGWYWGMAALSLTGVIRRNVGLEAEFGITGTLLLLTSLGVRWYCGRQHNGQPYPRWFALHLAICVAIEMGVFAEGMLVLIKDYAHAGEGIPSSLIFFETPDNTMCR